MGNSLRELTGSTPQGDKLDATGLARERERLWPFKYGAPAEINGKRENTVSAKLNGLLEKVGLGSRHREWSSRAGDIRHDTLPDVLSYSTQVQIGTVFVG